MFRRWVGWVFSGRGSETGGVAGLHAAPLCLRSRSAWGSDLPPVVPQGDFDQSRTKVLHLSLNPASVARQRFREDWQQLQEECKHLRELVRALEAGGPVPADLEAAAGLPSSKEVAGRPPPHPSVCRWATLGCAGCGASVQAGGRACRAAGIGQAPEAESPTAAASVSAHPEEAQCAGGTGTVSPHPRAFQGARKPSAAGPARQEAAVSSVRSRVP